MQVTRTQPRLPFEPALQGIYLGTVSKSFNDSNLDFEDADPNWVELTAIRSGERIGEPGGYSSAADAIDSLRILTKDSKPGAAVFERNGRFYANELVGRDLNHGTSTKWRRLNINTGLSNSRNGYGLTSTKHVESAGVVAILDGHTNIYLEK